MTITQLLKITGTIACQYLTVSPELAQLRRMAQEILQIDSRKFVEIKIKRIFCFVFSKASLLIRVLAVKNLDGYPLTIVDILYIILESSRGMTVRIPVEKLMKFEITRIETIPMRKMVTKFIWTCLILLVKCFSRCGDVVLQKVEADLHKSFMF
jgi:hypothetical protein